MRRALLMTALAMWMVALVAFAAPAHAADLSVVRQFFSADETVTIDAAEGHPPSALVRSRDGRVLAYAFSTLDVSGSVGYSGRPLDIVAAVTPEGVIAGALLVAHQEPILTIGITSETLARYLAGFKGFDVRASGVRGVPQGGARPPDAVAGATVTSAVIRDALVRSARTILRARAPRAAASALPRIDRETRRTLSWDALTAESAVRRASLKRGEAARLLGVSDQEPDKIFVDLWLAVATPPAIGGSLLGERFYDTEIAQIGPEDDLLLIAAAGLYSFKGTEWRRTGVFDRIEVIQNAKTFRLRADDHVRIDRLRAAGAPEMREIGLFRIAHGSGLDLRAPFRLALTVDGGAGTAPAGSAVLSLDYAIPSHYLVGPAPARDRAVEQPTAAPASQADAGADTPLWQDIWWARRFELGGLVLMLTVLGAVLIFQNAVTSRGRFYQALRIGYLAVTVVFLGLIANAQLSVVHVVTFAHALLTGFRWELFLLDPIVFTLWSFVAVSMLFWGRGVFCGWLCPFGALQELLNRLAQKVGIRQIELPFGVHERLWMIKYVFFLSIFAISLHTVTAAFQAAEVEPFKTVITLKFMRAWPFVLYAGILILLGLFVQRAYCRYLCPLGAALAIPARLRMFEWLKRYRECGAECQVCARRCTVQAIHPLGQINPNECIYCLQCQANYYDARVCLHLKKREERRRPRPPVAAVGAAAAVAPSVAGPHAP